MEYSSTTPIAITVILVLVAAASIRAAAPRESTGQADVGPHIARPAVVATVARMHRMWESVVAWAYRRTAATMVDRPIRPAAVIRVVVLVHSFFVSSLHWGW